MMSRKLLSLLVLLTVATGAWADDSGSCGTGVTYSYVESTHTLTISGTGAMTNYNHTVDRPWDGYAEYITSVVLADGLTNIGKYAFYGFTNLATVAIGSGVTSIGDDAFNECDNIATITVDGGNSKYDSRGDCNAIIETTSNTLVLGCKGTTIPNTVTAIGDYAFYGSVGLTSINIPASVTSIGNTPFLRCSNLTTITVDEGNPKYDSRGNCNAIIETSTNTLVYGCKGTTNVPFGVTSIGESAFYGMELTSITIPTSMTSIGDLAFGACASLTSVVIYAPNCSLAGFLVFLGCSESIKIYVFSDFVNDYKGAANWSYYASYIEALPSSIKNGYCGAEGHESDVRWVLTGVNPCNLTIMKTGSTGAMRDYAQPQDRPWNLSDYLVKNLVIEDGVTSIGARAFYDCSYAGLTSINIPASVTSIGIDAFAYCYSLTSIAIPPSVTSIGDGAFRNCSDLATVTLNSNPYIGTGAFNNIKEGATVTMNLTANSASGAKWTTFYNENYNFQADANTQVFKAALSGTKLKMNKVANRIVDANVGVVLKSSGNPVMTLTTSASGDTQNNSLQGVDDPAGLTAADPSTMYVLNNGSHGVGFYKLTAGETLGVGKAYLTYSGAGAPEFFSFGVENTSLSEELRVKSEEFATATVYDLQGRKVNGQWSIVNGQSLKKGLYIVNGKKVIIK